MSIYNIIYINITICNIIFAKFSLQLKKGEMSLTVLFRVERYIFSIHTWFILVSFLVFGCENGADIDTVWLYEFMQAMPKKNLGFGGVVAGTHECMHQRAGVLSQLPQKACPSVRGITRPLSAHRNLLIIHTPMNSDHIFLGSGKKWKWEGGWCHAFEQCFAVF